MLIKFFIYLMDNLVKDNFSFKKISQNININSVCHFTNNNEICYSSAGNIISYNLDTNMKTDIFRISHTSITFFKIIKENFFCLTKDNKIIKYDLKERTAHMLYLKKDTQVINFSFSHFAHSLILLTAEGDIIYVSIETFKEMKSFQILKNQNQNKIFSNFFEISPSGKSLITNNKNTLLIVNLLNHEVNEQKLNKSLNCAVMIDDNNLIVGDWAGKIHIINIEKNKVRI
jgi:hypothetical protein